MCAGGLGREKGDELISSIGDVFVSLRLDSSQFERGVAVAQQQAARLGQVLDQFGRPLARVSSESAVTGTALQGTGEAATRSGHSFNASGQQMARFAAIGIQQVIPSLDGSRVALEGAIQGVTRLTSGYGLLALGGIGVAAALGGALFLSLRSTEQGTRDTVKGVVGLDDTIGRLEKQIDENVESLGKWRALMTPLSGAETAFNLFPEDQAKTARDQIDAISARVTRLRDQVEKLKGAKLLEDPAAGQRGSLTIQIANAEAASLFTVEQKVKSFVATAAQALVNDPLQKMLIADANATRALIDQIEALTGVTTKERESLLSSVSRFGDLKQQALRESGAADRATKLGVGDANPLAGLRDLKALDADVKNFKQDMIDLANAGIPVRDVFPLIAEGQEKFNQKLSDYKTKYADVPSILNKLVDAEREVGNSGIIRDLTQQFEGLGKAKKGAVTAEDAQGNLLEKINLAPKSLRTLVDSAEEGTKAFDITNISLRNTGVAVSSITTAIDDGVIPAIADWSLALEAFNIQAFTTNVVTLTGDVYALARAFNSMRIEALAAAGAGAGVGQTAVPGLDVPAPGNF